MSELGDTRRAAEAPRARRVWDFIWLNALAVSAMLVLFFAVLYGDAATAVFAAAWRWFSAHEVVMALAASAPFFAALLVGRASVARARRRRTATRAEPPAA